MSMSGKGRFQSQAAMTTILHSPGIAIEAAAGRAPSVMARREAFEDAKVTVLQVAAGESHTLALTATGVVYSWGRGLFGRSGVGVFQDELIPTHIPVGNNPDDDDDDRGSLASSHSSSGRLGVDNDTASSSAAAQRSFKAGSKAGNRVTQVAAGAYHNLALTADGSIWSWGYNAYMDGQLGHDKTASQPSPLTFTYRTPADEVRRGGALWRKSVKTDDRKQPKIIQVEAGGMISSAIDLDGVLWIWGAVPNPSKYNSETNSSRNLGFVVVNVDRPEIVRGLLGLRVYRVACGTEHILALVEGRDDVDHLDCYAWGNNQFGQLGLGDFHDRPYPQVVKALAAAVLGSIVDMACGAFHSAILAVKAEHFTDSVREPSNLPRSCRKHQGWPSEGAIQDSTGAQTQKHPNFFRKQHQEESRVRPETETSSNLLKSTAWSSSRTSSSHSLSQSFPQPPTGLSRFSEGPTAAEGSLSVCWTFGQGEHGQLGHGTTSNSALPAPVDGLPNKERLRTVVSGLFHTAVVTETGDIWVWGMEGGLGVCPGIGPPGARNSDALSPVRVFGQSSANCHPVTGAKGITCGAAHTVTIANAGKDLWAWGRGQSGVLGLGHTSDSWFPCPVVWPPVALAPWGSKAAAIPSSARASIPSLQQQSDPLYPMGFHCRWSTQSSSSRDRGNVDDTKDSTIAEMNHPTWELASAATEPRNASATARDEVEAIKKELAGVRRYAASLHAAVYGEVEMFSQLQPGEHLSSDRNSDHSADSSSGNHPKQNTRGAVQKKKALQEWERRMESASDADLTRLDHYYRSMRVRLKELLFQRKMDEWCRRCTSAINSSSSGAASIEPPPRREPHSVASTPSMDDRSGEWALSKSGIVGDSKTGEIMQQPPPTATSSMAELLMLAVRPR